LFLLSLSPDKPHLPIIFSPEPLQKFADLSYNIIIRLQGTIPPKEFQSHRKALKDVWVYAIISSIKMNFVYASKEAGDN